MLTIQEVLVGVIFRIQIPVPLKIYVVPLVIVIRFDVDTIFHKLSIWLAWRKGCKSDQLVIRVVSYLIVIRADRGTV